MQPTTAPWQIHIPSNAAELYSTRHSNQDAIRVAASLDVNEFQEMTFMARNLARERLNSHVKWAKQSETAQHEFLQAACNQLPLLQAYERSWPLVIYITRYLENRAKPSFGRISEPEIRHGYRTRRQVSLGREAVPKPPNLRNLSNPARSSGRDFWKATKLSKRQCTAMVLILQRLANKHLQVNTLYLFQEANDIRRVHRMAIREAPILATQFEGAWLIKAYLTRYLRKKVSVNAEKSRQALIEGGGNGDGSVQKLDSQDGGSERWDDREWGSLGAGGQAFDNQPRFTSPNIVRNNNPSVVWLADNQSRFASTTIVYEDSSKIERTEAAPSWQPMPNPSVAGPAHSAPVQAFLRSLQPSMDEHFSLFLSWGIQDENALLTLKCWSSEEQHRFLSDSTFTKFQIYAIRNGLDAL